MMLNTQLRSIGMGLLLVASGGAITFGLQTPAARSISSLPLERSPVSAQLQSQANPSLTALEQAVHTQVNQYRTSQGLSSLKLDPRISEQARLHSQAMASGRVPFSHDGFDQRIQVISRKISYRGAAENVAYNRGFAQPDRRAVQGWLKSPGHLANIRGNYNLTGIGVALNSKGEYYFTQIFIRR